MQESIFTKIIKGDIPAYKIYEDSKTLAFLDIHPVQPGHVLIVPKLQVDRLERLPDEDYQAVFETVKKVMHRVNAILGDQYRACLKVEGFDVAHVHIHIIPCQRPEDFWAKQRTDINPDDVELTKMAVKLAFE